MEEKVVLIPFSVDQDWVDSVMCSIIEGGMCNAWCDTCDPKDDDMKGTEYRSEVISRGGTLVFELYEAIDDDGTLEYELDLDKLLEGFKKYVEYCSKRGRTFYTDASDIDAVEADGIIQFALFGEWIYG